MNMILNDAIVEATKVKAILYFAEDSYIDIPVEPDQRKKADMAVAMFYVLKDSVDRLSEYLEKLEEKELHQDEN